MNKLFAIALSLIATVATAGNWHYEEQKDRLTGQPKANVATLPSNVTWSNSAFLKIAKFTDETTVFLEVYQLLDCSARKFDCSIRFMFDEEKPVAFFGGLSKDYKTWIAKPGTEGELIAAISKAKVIKVELPLFRQGLEIRQFEPNEPLRTSLKAE